MDDPFKPLPRHSHPNEFRVVISSDSARELNDISSYERDLRLAAGYLRHYMGSDIEGDHDFGSPIDAMWTAAFVLYGRVFATGVRRAQKPGLDRLTADERELHDYLVDVRNKYVAHSANGFEQSQTVAFLVELENGERAMTGTAVEQTALSRISRASAERFADLCDLHLRGLGERARELTRTITDELLQMGGEKVFALPRYTMPNIDQNAVKERRK
ncbi:MAG TPA: hypothetical protein VNQ52_04260 [Microbacteriaceae bacterium]|nr:hypothetical protein [Microbacteriaceae bacterium]